MKIKLLSSLELMKKKRGTWPISPVQKVVPNKKKKTRQQLNKDMRLSFNG